MSFITEDATYGRSIVDAYVGTDNLTQVSVGNFTLRVTAANAIEFRTVYGTESVEVFRYNRWGGGGAEVQTFDAQALSTGAWVIPDALILTDGSDMIHIWVCRTADGDKEWYEFKVWHPTPTKLALMGQRMDAPGSPTAIGANTLTMPGTVLTHNVSGVTATLDLSSLYVVHHHRVALGDAPVMSTFNGNNYSIANGWVPQVAGRRLVTPLSTYTNFGLNWRPTMAAVPIWELYGDAAIITESWTVDLIMTRHPRDTVKRYGIFN